ncbi:MAG: Lon protease family protein, partial [Actinomycetota bacterium]
MTTRARAHADPLETAPRRRRRFAVAAAQLRRRVDPRTLPFRTTADVEPLVGTIGQPRALEAIELGLAISTPGFNVYVAGAPGSGRTTTVHDCVERRAATLPPPADWVYVHDFDGGDRPNAIRLPAGRGSAFAGDMEQFVDAVRREVRRAFESDEYGRREQEILKDIARRRDQFARTLVALGHRLGFAVDVTPAGVVTRPLVDDKPISRQEFDALPPERREAMEEAARQISDESMAFSKHIHALEKEAVQAIAELEREVALFAIGPLLRELRDRYAAEPEVLAHLDAVEQDVVANLADFRDGEESSLPALIGGGQTDMRRYRVNVLVDNAGGAGAPVVAERNATYYNLMGRVQYRVALGAMMTDFREIKAGALHRANGGFLVLDMLDLLRHPFSWEALKRALQTREIRIENLSEEFTAVPTATLRAEPIPLDVKIVLIGPARLYHLLYAVDETFAELFKVKADFAPEVDWSDEAFASYAAFVSRWVSDAGLRHLDRTAVARLIEYGARLREDQRKLSTRLMDVSDVVSEASFWAGEAGREVATAVDVDHAIAHREYRSNLLEERVRSLIDDGTILIDTEGGRVGQVNGVAVLDVGDHAFGRPSRVTASVSLGREGIQSIEREIELSGPIHSKGFLTILGYLSGRYAQEWPLALSATLAFEQSYDEVEGDSASSAELYALLSALAEVPLDQGIAVTGSVNQRGEIQAVGGVTHKVEGFFATCKARGLTGRQGVVIPAANVRNLMLSDEVVAAVRGRHFHVWAVRTVDEGIELLTGIPAGERTAEGTYPP